MKVIAKARVAPRRPLSHHLTEPEDLDGGAECIVCGAFDGELLSYCPGYQLSYDARESCFNGDVVDFVFWQQAHRRGPISYVPPTAFPEEA